MIESQKAFVACLLHVFTNAGALIVNSIVFYVACVTVEVFPMDVEILFA